MSKAVKKIDTKFAQGFTLTYQGNVVDGYKETRFTVCMQYVLSTSNDYEPEEPSSAILEKVDASWVVFDENGGDKKGEVRAIRSQTDGQRLYHLSGGQGGRTRANPMAFLPATIRDSLQSVDVIYEFVPRVIYPLDDNEIPF